MDEELAYVLASLADALALVRVPGAAFVDDIAGDAEIEEIAFLGDSLSVENVELCLTERCGHLVLDDLDAGAVAHDLIAIFDRRDTSGCRPAPKSRT